MKQDDRELIAVMAAALLAGGIARRGESAPMSAALAEKAIHSSIDTAQVLLDVIDERIAGRIAGSRGSR